MQTTHIERQFARIGARVRLHAAIAQRDRIQSAALRIDINSDEHGEYFDLSIGSEPPEDIAVVDAQPNLRHLLLMSRDRSGKHKFLCGHDERHWFVAAVPELAAATSVQSAFRALQPAAIRAALERAHVRPRDRNLRRNAAFLRQGEWFFLPVPPNVRLDESLILRDEPLRRGAGKPHRCEELIRTGGILVYVSTQHPQGLTGSQYQKLLSRRPELRNLHWVTQRRNPSVFVRGRVRHADHKTILLHGWHQVLMNTETEAVAMRHVAFLD